MASMPLRRLLGSCLGSLVIACGGSEGSDAGTTEGGSDGAASTGMASTSGGPVGDATGDPSTGSATAPTTDDPDASSGGGTPGGTPGCGLEVPVGDATVEIMVGSDLREYIVVVPDGYDPSTPMPLVFAWHGRGGTADLARLYFQVEQAAGGQAIFVYPQGLPLASMGGQTGWDLAPTGYDVAFFDAMLDEVSAGLCIDPARVFTTGHSFGGYMSNALGCFRSSVLRAIGSVAGGPPFGACESDTVAAWLTHGTEDQVVPFSQGEASRDALLDRNGCADTTMPTEPDPCVAYDGCAEGMPVVWCPHGEIELSGHMWPRFAGPAIWAFFEALGPKP
jgi:polyhydroxybutyrate depolymerase